MLKPICSEVICQKCSPSMHTVIKFITMGCQMFSEYLILGKTIDVSFSLGFSWGLMLKKSAL